MSLVIRMEDDRRVMRQFGEEGGKSTDGGQKGRLEAKIEGGERGER